MCQIFRPLLALLTSQRCVCESWTRMTLIVGTPLLYRVVILQSKAQAHALEHTLRQHKEFSVCIRKLRVEGGYGSAMRTIITSAPSITHLCLSLDIRSSDSVKGLCCSLLSINPLSVVIRDACDERKNAPLKELVAKVNACFKVWTSMTSLLQSASFNCWTTDLC
jgi:hypothetical protein